MPTSTLSLPFPAPTLPVLPDALHPKDKKAGHSIAALQAGDQLHLTAAILGLPKGSVLPIAGLCRTVTPDGLVVNVVAYVLPRAATAQAALFTQRDYHRFPCALYQEEWFGTPPVVLVEIDLTDYADCIRLERRPQALAEMLDSEPITRRQWVPTNEDRRAA